MALSAMKLRLEAFEAYDRHLQDELRREPSAVSFYHDHFWGTRLQSLYKRRRVVLRPEFWPYLAGVNAMREYFVREPETWRACGHSIPTVIWSLVRHLFCRYPMPYFWLGEWLRDQEDRSMARLHAFTQIGSGMSIYKLSRMGILGMELSRKECHMLPQMYGVWGLGAACRMTQVLARGGSRDLGHAIARCPWGNWAAVPELETRRQAAITWMCGQPDLTRADLDAIASAVDRFGALRLEGRSIASARAWIRERERPPGPAAARAQHDEEEERDLVPQAWWSCGLRPHLPGRRKHDAWSIRELTTREAVRQEGVRMRHCVLDYARSASRGECSLWSMRINGISVLTLELRGLRIVQIRGRHNRDPSRGELKLVRHWARDNGLRFDLDPS